MQKLKTLKQILTIESNKLTKAETESMSFFFCNDLKLKFKKKYY